MLQHYFVGAMTTITRTKNGITAQNESKTLTVHADMWLTQGLRIQIDYKSEECATTLSFLNNISHDDWQSLFDATKTAQKMHDPDGHVSVHADVDTLTIATCVVYEKDNRDSVSETYLKLKKALIVPLLKEVLDWHP